MISIGSERENLESRKRRSLVTSKKELMEGIFNEEDQLQVAIAGCHGSAGAHKEEEEDDYGES